MFTQSSTVDDASHESTATFTFNFTYSEQDLHDLCRQVFRASRKGIWRLWAVVLVICFITIVTAGVDHLLSFLLFVAFIAAVLGAFHVYVYRWPIRQTAKLLHEPNLRGDQVIKLSAEGLRATDENAESLYRWSAVKNVQLTPHTILLYIQAQLAIIIPRRAVGDDRSIQSLLAQIDAWRIAAPPHEHACPQCGYELHAGRSPGCPECGWRRMNNGES